MENETSLQIIGNFIIKWKWLLVALFLLFMYSTGSNFVWGGDKIAAQVDTSIAFRQDLRRLDSRIDTIEAVILPAIDFLITRECMDPTLPIEMYSSQRCFSRLQRHDIPTKR